MREWLDTLKRSIWRWPKPIRLAAGSALLVLGFLGLFLPLLQGLLLLAAGGALLVHDLPAIRRWADRTVTAWRHRKADLARRSWIRLTPPVPARGGKEETPQSPEQL